MSQAAEDRGFFMNSYAALRPLLDGQRMLAPMFYLGYMFSELRRRKGRTLLTALGLGVGVGLVVTVSALSKGLDSAQDKVLRPLTGVGTDMSVTRPLTINDNGNGPGGLSPSERAQLQRENGPRRFDLSSQAKPGQKFTRTDFMSAAQLSFPASQVAKIAKLDGVQSAAGSLTLNAVTIKGTVPKNGFQRPAPGSAAATADAARAVRRHLAQRDRGRREQAVARAPSAPTRSPRAATSGPAAPARPSLNESYARRNSLERRRHDQARRQDVQGRRPRRARRSAARPSDVYVKLAQLQKLSDRDGPGQHRPGAGRHRRATSRRVEEASRRR